MYCRFWIAFSSVLAVPIYLATLCLWNSQSYHCIQSVCAKALNSLSASLGYFLPFVMDLWTPTSLETRLFIFFRIYKDAWIYSPSSWETPLANSCFQVESRSVTRMSCSLPVLSQDRLWLKTWVGRENKAQPHSETSLGRRPRQCRAGPWVVPSKKAVGIRQVSYWMICAISTADADVRLLWRRLTEKAAGSWRCHSLLYPCKYIRTFDSKPSSWITELTFFYLIFQLELRIFTDGSRMTVQFCSNFYSFVPRQNENKFLQMFLQNQRCIRMSLLMSTSLVGWERGRQLRFESLLCLSQSAVF